MRRLPLRSPGVMPVIRFTCAHCNAVLSVKDTLAGTTGPCPRCKGVIRVPGAEPEEDAPAARPRPAPEPDDADVIEFARGKFRRSMVWVLCFQAFALLVGCGCLFGAVVVARLEPLSVKMVTAELFAGGVAFVGFAYFYMGVCSWKLFFASTVPATDHFLLTADGLRRYTARGDLVEDIPYANIADVRLVTRRADDNPDVKVRILGIDLRDPDHADTTLDDTYFRWSRQMYEHDVVLIPEFFAGSLKGVHKKIRQRWQRWQDANGPDAAVKSRRSRRRAAAAWYKSPVPYAVAIIGVAGAVALVILAGRVPGRDVVEAPAPAPAPPPAPAPAVVPVQLTAPVAHWPLDEGQGTDAADVTGKSMTAHLKGGAAWGAGVKGAGVRLDGKTGYVDLGPIAPNFAAGAPFTVCVWVTTDAADGVICSFRGQASAAPVIELSVRGGKLAGWVRDNTSGQGGAKLLGGKADDGKWHHAALVREPDGTVELYLDGASQGRDKGANSGGPISANSRALGCDRLLLLTGKKAPGFLAGGLDDFRVYDRRLPADEIAALARGPQ